MYSQITYERDPISERFEMLSQIGVALMSENDEGKLLRLIAENAARITGAEFAAFMLRPIREDGQLSEVPGESEFRLATVVGVSPEQEQRLRRLSLRGLGLLKPIFQDGQTILLPDVQASIPLPSELSSAQDTAAHLTEKRRYTFAYIHGQLKGELLQGVGAPNDEAHPSIRSFLGAPLLNRHKVIFGTLLLGHSEPLKFSRRDEDLLIGLASQSAIALENVRLGRLMERRVNELDAIVTGISDGVILTDQDGKILLENNVAKAVRSRVLLADNGEETLQQILARPVQQTLQGAPCKEILSIELSDPPELSTYEVTSSLLCDINSVCSKIASDKVLDSSLDSSSERLVLESHRVPAVLVVWHDVTPAHQLIATQQLREQAVSHLTLFQQMLDELPNPVYIVRGCDARLAISNQATKQLWRNWDQGLPFRDWLRLNGIRLFDVNGRPISPDQYPSSRALNRNESAQYVQEYIRYPDDTSMMVVVHAIRLNIGSADRENLQHLLPDLKEDEPLAVISIQDVSILKEADRVKDEFIAIAAHELRTPLAILSGFAQTLLVQTARGHGPPLEDWQHEALDGIEQSSSRMAELIADLLDITRLQAGQLKFRPEAFDVVALVERVVKRMQMTTTTHQLQLQKNAESMVIDADPRRVEQILTNMIANAIKYSPGQKSVSIRVTKDESDYDALIAVQDYGIGIPENQWSRVFSRFERGDNARAYGIGGTGLGLYLCQELVERQGGRIWFTSTEGKGSTFYISLPGKSPLS
ncbi:GAF domain-containing sensor histidine kinase [Tengunoibacter tsumagoiensis]|uniref:histidine kinase n=1 Tax=Tengunoibacter tsumagoiensis TaxID=2014871 RepID=A0A402AB48_9CHLR|nr:GAF domain-containing sensor histidine kinase [Tengunoibacter tsumagoiensis]GCE16185.1 histidine kinase [Tengunoibacter tsumagoiensis]